MFPVGIRKVENTLLFYLSVHEMTLCTVLYFLLSSKMLTRNGALPSRILVLTKKLVTSIHYIAKLAITKRNLVITATVKCSITN